MAERVKLKEKERKPGAFEKGHPKMGGRKLGTPNKVTSKMKDILMEAAAMVGFDGEGMGGIHGYCARVAMLHPDKYIDQLGRLSPITMEGRMDFSFTKGKYETVEDLAVALRERGLPPPSKLIDVTPRPVRKATKDDD